MSKENMTECKACNKEIAKGVKKCPNCGKDQRNFFAKHKIITVILALFVLGIAGAALGGGSDTPSGSGVVDSGDKDTGNKEKDENKDPAEEKTEFVLGEVISFKDFDLTVSNQREIEGITNTVYTVFDVEIVSKKDNFSFTGNFQGETEDNEIVDDTLAMISEDIGDPIMTAVLKSLDEGQKVKGYLAFDKAFSKIEIRSDAFARDKITIITE